eukprot:411029-Rhodomonas_salina.3
MAGSDGLTSEQEREQLVPHHRRTVERHALSPPACGAAAPRAFVRRRWRFRSAGTVLRVVLVLVERIAEGVELAAPNATPCQSQNLASRASRTEQIRSRSSPRQSAESQPGKTINDVSPGCSVENVERISEHALP